MRASLLAVLAAAAWINASRLLAVALLAVCTLSADAQTTMTFSQYLDNGGVLTKLAGAKLVGSRGQSLGTVQKVLTEPVGRQAAIVIAPAGVARPTSKVATVSYADVRVTAEGDTVYLELDRPSLEELPDYRELAEGDPCKLFPDLPTCPSNPIA